MTRRLISLILLLSALAVTMAACSGWQCMAKPTLGPDAKQVMRIQGFEVKCMKRF